MGLTKISGGVIQSDNFSVGVITATSLQIGSATTIHTTGIDLGSGNITSHNINSTGIITATGVTVTGDLNATSGSVGIGTDNPETKLNIVGSTASASSSGGTLGIRQKGDTYNDGITLTSSHSNSARFWKDSDGKLHIFNTGTGSNQFVLDNAGRVGIGTDNPSQEIELFGNAFTGIKLRSSRTGLTEQIGGVGFSTSFDQVATINALVDGTVVIKNTTSDTERFRIDSAGNIGIGTDNPQEKLHVLGTSDFVVDTDTSGLRFGSYGEYDIALVTGRNTSANSSRVYIENGDGEALRINSVGRVGINSSLPASLVDIRGESAESAVVNIRSYDKSSAIKLWPSNAHDLDRWRMAFWENNSQTDGNNYPDWMVDGYGRQWQQNNLYIGRTRTFGDGPSSQYPYYGSSGPGVFIYNGVDGDNTNYSAYLKLGIYQSDDDDRNIIYYTHTSTTATVDYDAHQTFGVTGSGRVQAMHQFFSGRVESDEGTPNSVYTDSVNNGFFSYYGSGFSAYIRSRNTDNTDVCYYLDTGGGPVFKIVSNGNGYFDGGADVGSADYAEYFEWADGNPNNEDRRGYPVIVVPNTNGKIGIATTGDDRSQIMGIVSANPGVVGDTASLNWQGRHLKDEWGSWVTEDQEFLVWNKKGTYINENGEKVENPQPNVNDPNCDPEYSVLVSEIETTPDIPQYALDNNLRVTKPARVTNPDFDPSQTYTPRSDRQEWSAVGLMGKLWLRPNQPTRDCWIKLKDGSNGLSYWLIR